MDVDGHFGTGSQGAHLRIASIGPSRLARSTNKLYLLEALFICPCLLDECPSQSDQENHARRNDSLERESSAVLTVE